MGCRCSDIYKCKRDIGRIESITNAFEFNKGLDEQMDFDLHNLAAKCSNAFYAVNMDSLEHEEISLNDDMTEMLPQKINECIQKLRDLEHELSSMQDEDDYFHEHENDDD